jgi:sulfite reductase alpha subunit-like flavoprotein
MNIIIQGKVIDCYEKPIYINKESGETTPKKFAVQLLANQKLNNGASKKELVDITIDEKEIQKYQSNVGKDMEINCKLYSKSAISLTAV